MRVLDILRTHAEAPNLHLLSSLYVIVIIYGGIYRYREPVTRYAHKMAGHCGFGTSLFRVGRCIVAIHDIPAKLYFVRSLVSTPGSSKRKEVGRVAVRILSQVQLLCCAISRAAHYTSCDATIFTSGPSFPFVQLASGHTQNRKPMPPYGFPLRPINFRNLWDNPSRFVFIRSTHELSPCSRWLHISQNLSH